MQTLSKKIRVAERPTFELMLPPTLRKKVRVGDFFRVEWGAQTLVLRPSRAISPEDAWFFTQEWQKKEQVADTDIRKKRMHGPYKTAVAMFRDFGMKPS
ncbi:hypothetical protein HY625_02360 [Candidatus Uhrbacteria bacterium]|nr:hypothetical protein [Candidatus Uhrbacteria bacterium]